MTTETITFTFPNDAARDRGINALARRFGYATTVANPGGGMERVANPEEKLTFVKRKLGEMIIDQAIHQIVLDAAAEAQVSARATASTAAAAVAVG